MASEADETYDKIQRFAEDILQKYQETKNTNTYYCLKSMVKHGLIAGFDPERQKIYMEQPVDPWKFDWENYFFIGEFFFWKHFTPVTYNIWTDEEAQIYSLV